MSQEIFKPSAEALSHCSISQAGYHQSSENNESYWSEMANRIDWFTPPTQIKNVNFDMSGGKPVSIKWYEDGALNACYNCIDRHLPEKTNKTALIWEGDNPDESLKITYGELKEQVSKLANALKEMNVQKGDRVTIYMPMVPEAVYAMLACARIGAVHSVVFGGFWIVDQKL
jgi:acetyl-CoA synthetase